MLKAMIREYVNILSLLIRYPFSKKYHYTAGEGKPILLIHGYLHNASAWYALIDRLKKEKMGPIYAIDLGNGTLKGKFWPIHKYAAQVAAKIEETGQKDFTIIGHSMGGLVATLSTKIASPGTISHIYTLGTPFYGSPIAKYLGVGPNGREMVPGSKFLQEVRQDLKNTSSQIHYRHIGSKMDFIVPVHAGLDITFEDLGHVTLLTSDQVADQLSEWLRIDRKAHSSEQKSRH